MATFNTAFGALPKPQDQVFGNRRQPRDDDETRQRQERAFSPDQPQAQQPRQESRTFAQMQQSGQARPAPAPAQAPVAQPPMLNDLNQMLNTQQMSATNAAYSAASQQPRQQTTQQLQDDLVAKGAQVKAQAGQPVDGTAFISQLQNALGADQQQSAPMSQAATQVQPAAAPAAVQAAAPEPPPAVAAANVSTAAPMTAPAPVAAPSSAASATPSAAATPGVGSGASASAALRARLEQQLAGYTGGPSVYEDPAYKAYRESQLANMESEFGAKRSALEEELAARGLASSSIAGGRFGDLAGQQARARATMEADLMKEAAARQEARSQFGLSQMGSLAEMSGRQEVSEADIDLRAKQLQQEERLKGRELDLTQARDLASKELGYAEIGSRERMSAAELGSRERISASEIASREGIAGKELTQREKEFGITSQLDREKFAADVDYRTKQLMMDDKRLTYEQARDKANREVEQARLAEQERANRAGESAETRRIAEQERANQAQERANELDRNLREKLGLSTLDLDKQRFNLSADEFKLRLAEILSSKTLSEQEKQQLRDRYIPRPVLTPGGSGGGTGGGFGNDTGI